MEKNAPIRGKGPLHGLAPMNDSNYKMHIILGNYSSHNYIKIHSRMHPKSLKFSWRSIPSNPIAIKLNIVIYTARQCKRDVL